MANSSGYQQRSEGEWLMTEKDVKKWRTTAAKDVQPLQHLRKFLSNKLIVSSNTFATGMTVVLYQSCVSNSLEMVEYLLEKYVDDHDINQLIAVNPDPYRPFPSKAISDKVAMIKTTLVHGAVLGSSIPILKLLSRHGASFFIPDCCKKIPIMIAIYNRDVEIVKFFLARAGDASDSLNCKDLDGQTPLMYATREPSMSELIPLMVKSGADMCLMDNRGFTALHTAVYEGTSEAVRQLLQLDVLKKVDFSGIPHPSVLFDCNDKHRFSTDVRKSAICSSFENCSAQLSSKQHVDMLLVHATFHLYDRLRFKESIAFFEHRFAEAMVLKKALAIPIDLGTTEIQTYKELEAKLTKNGLSEGSKVIEGILQSMQIQTRCIGKGSKTIFDFAKVASMWMFEKAEYKHGLTIFHQMSDMLVYITTKPNHPSVGCLQQMFYTFSSIIKRLFYHSISSTAQAESVPEIKLISKHLVVATFNPIFINIVHSLCFCSRHAKQTHSHKISKKSTSLLIQELYSLLNFAINKPELGINTSKIIAELVEKCPSTLIDINGNPTSILHLALTSEPRCSQEITKQILENGGDYLVNAVGPCGNRPIQTTYNESMIQLLLDYGAHLDAVNMSGHSVIDQIKPFIPEALIITSVKRLSCICALFVADSIPYYSMDLPVKVKKQILLHDKKAESILAKEELLLD